MRGNKNLAFGGVLLLLLWFSRHQDQKGVMPLPVCRSRTGRKMQFLLISQSLKTQTLLLSQGLLSDGFEMLLQLKCRDLSPCKSKAVMRI